VRCARGEAPRGSSVPILCVHRSHPSMGLLNAIWSLLQLKPSLVPYMSACAAPILFHPRRCYCSDPLPAVIFQGSATIPPTRLCLGALHLRSPNSQRALIVLTSPGPLLRLQNGLQPSGPLLLPHVLATRTPHSPPPPRLTTEELSRTKRQRIRSRPRAPTTL
jgi:hypothetical protein